MAVTPKRMSLAEFLELPEVKPALELRHGMVSQKMPPSGPHVAIQVWFGYQVDMFAEPQELARAFPEVRLILGNDTYVTDVAVYRWDRIPVDEHGDLPMHFRTPPDLAVEVISPGQTMRDQMDKCREYLGHGVRVAVVADPIRRSVFVLRANGEVGPLQEGDDIDITDVLPGFQMRVSDLFSRIKARPPKRGQ
jgi:Uma2 family endonuclease